jgi:hypothetical protein
MRDAIEDDTPRHEETHAGQRIDLRERRNVEVELSADIAGAIERRSLRVLDRVANSLRGIG